jgi:hypothetical protein
MSYECKTVVKTKRVYNLNSSSPTFRQFIFREANRKKISGKKEKLPVKGAFKNALDSYLMITNDWLIISVLLPMRMKYLPGASSRRSSSMSCAPALAA